MKYLSEYMQDAQSALFEKTGSFFAFGQKQFEEKAKPGIKYVDLGAGLICPKETAKELTIGLDEIYVNAIKQDVEENGAEKIIRREYFNHETQISCDWSDAIANLTGHKKQFPDMFTDQEIERVFNKCFQEAIDNDLF